MTQYFDVKSISNELSLESMAERLYTLDMDKSTLTMSKNSKIQGRHMIIEIKCGQMMMNEFTCNDLLRKVKDNCCKTRSGSNGLITYRDCKQMLSDAECTPNIDTRFECILVQLFPVSCIILKNSILVVANEDINIDSFIKNLCRITNLYHLKEYTRKNDEKDSSTYPQYGSLSSTAEEIEHTSDTTLPFEISLLECCYTTAISHLEMDLVEIEKKFKLVEEMASNNKKYKHISIIIHELKQPVSNLTEIMKGYEELMNELLNSQENMNLLEFSNHNKLYSNDNSTNDLAEFPINRDLESLLEYFDQEIENLSKRSRTIYTSLVHLERHINLELSITRNEIMRFELMCSIIGTAFGAGACVSGLFGMNVVNGFEQSRSAFILISVSFLLVFFIAIFVTKILHVRHRV